MSRLNPPIRPNISGSHSNDLNSIVDAVYAEGSGGGPTISPSLSSLVDAVYDEGTREGIRAVDAAFPSNPSDRVAAGLSPTPPQRPTTTSGAAGDFVTSAMLSGIGQVPGMLSGAMRFAQSGMEFQRNPHVGLTVAGGQLADAVTAGERMTNPMLAGMPAPSDYAMRAVSQMPRTLPANSDRLVSGVLGRAADATARTANDIAQLMPEDASRMGSPAWAGKVAGGILPQVGLQAAVGVATGGAAVPSMVPMFLMEAGDSTQTFYDALRQRGYSEEDALAGAFLPAVGASLAKSGIEQMGGKEKVLRDVARQMARGVVKDAREIAETAVKSAGAGAAEELSQGEIDRTVAAVLSGQYGHLLTPEVMQQRFEEAIGGAIGESVAAGGFRTMQAIPDTSGRAKAGRAPGGGQQNSSPSSPQAPQDPSGTSTPPAPSPRVAAAIKAAEDRLRARYAGKTDEEIAAATAAMGEDEKAALRDELAAAAKAAYEAPQSEKDAIMARLGIKQFPSPQAPANPNPAIAEQTPRRGVNTLTEILANDREPPEVRYARGEITRDEMVAELEAAFANNPSERARREFEEMGKRDEERRRGDSNEGGVVAGGVRGPGPVEGAGGGGVAVPVDVRAVGGGVAPVVGGEGQQAGDQPGDVGGGRSEAEVIGKARELLDGIENRQPGQGVSLVQRALGVGYEQAKAIVESIDRAAPPNHVRREAEPTQQDYDDPSRLRNIGVGRIYAGRRVLASMSARGEPTTDPRMIDSASDYRRRGMEVLIRRDGEGFGYVIGVKPQQPGAVTAAPQREGASNGQGQEEGNSQELLKSEASSYTTTLRLPEMVKAEVVSGIHDRKVFDPVVTPIAVDVMDMLAARKLTPEMVLHDPSVLSDVSPADLDPLVVSGFWDRTRNVLTESGTKLLGSELARVAYEEVSASRARLLRGSTVSLPRRENANAPLRAQVGLLVGGEKDRSTNGTRGASVLRHKSSLGAREERLLTNEPAAPETSPTGVLSPPPAGAATAAPSVSPDLDAMSHDELKAYAKSIGVPPRGSPAGIRDRIRKAQQQPATASNEQTRPEPPKGKTPEYDALPAATREQFEAAYQARDVDAMAGFLHAGNKVLRREFAARSGLDRVPPGVKRTRAAVEAWAAQRTETKSPSPSSVSDAPDYSTHSAARADSGSSVSSLTVSSSDSTPVPPEVLKDYPDLAAKADTSPPSSASERPAAQTAQSRQASSAASSPSPAPAPRSVPATATGSPSQIRPASAATRERTSSASASASSPKSTLATLSPEKEARLAELKKRLAAKLNTELRSGFDPELFAIGAEMTALYVEKGARSFASFARQMVADLGESVKPYLKAFYNGARDMPGVDASGMDDAATVAAYNLDGLETEDPPGNSGGGPTSESSNRPAGGSSGTSVAGAQSPGTPPRVKKYREMADRLIAKAEALEKNSSRRFDDAPGAAITGGSGRRRSGLHKKTDRAIGGSLNDLQKAKRLREAAGKWNARADNIDPEVIRQREQRKAVVLEAREKVKAKESAERKAAPIINEDREGVLRITADEWKKADKDYKGISVRDGMRVRTLLRGGSLHEVFITDMPVKTRADAVKESPSGSQNQQSKPRVYNGDKGSMKSLGLEPAKQVRALSPNKRSGWHYVETPDGAALVDPFDDYGVRFVAENEKSGSDLLRARTEAKAYADDHPVEKKPWQMTREQYSATVIPELQDLLKMRAAADRGMERSARKGDDTAVGSYRDDYERLTAELDNKTRSMHERQVRRAHAEGLPVPDAVLAEYGLANKAGDLVVKPIGGDAVRAGLTLKQNQSGMWAWFDGETQKTGAYRTPEEAQKSPEIEAREFNASAAKSQPSEVSIKTHPEYERLDRVYGNLTKEQLDAKIAEMTADIAQHAKAARREFDGNGGRRTSAAVSAQAVRDIGEEKLLLSAYAKEKFAAKPAAPTVTNIGKYRVFERPGEGWAVNFDQDGAIQGRRGLKTREEAESLARQWDARDQEIAADRRKNYPMTLAEYPKVRDRIMSGDQTAEEHKELARWLMRSESAIKAELGQKTLKQLAPNGTGGNTKASIIDTIYRNMLGRFHLGDSVSYNPFGGETYESALIKKIEATTDQDIQKFKADRQGRIDARKKALENPETLDEFRQFIEKNGEAALSVEQRKKYDELTAAVNKRMRGDDRPDYIAKVDTGGVQLTVKEGFHEKAKIPLWIVQMSGRVDSDAYKALVEAAKKLGGWWSSFKKESTGFQFKTKAAADEFVQINQKSITTETTDKAREETQAEKAAARLIEMADAKIEAADEELGRDRNTNTVRRARMADSAEAGARKAKQMAETLANIAEGIQNGTAKALRGIRNMAQLEELERSLMLAQREYWYSLPEESRRAIDPSGNWWNLPMDENIIAKAVMPMPAPHISHVREIASKGMATAGIKREAAKLDKLWRYSLKRNPDSPVVTIDNPYDFNAAKAVASRLKGAGSSKYAAESVYDALMHHQRVADMGIKSSAEMRVALREYMGFRAGQAKPDAIREMERGLIGKTVGIDFFPTPPALAAEVVEKADIEPGMKVLEPSAGNGRIADAIKAAGVTPDVAEVSGDLRAILEKKGYPLEGRDFMEFNPGPVYDRIVMNPPFSNRMDVEHVRHAYDLLKPGGRIVAIMSEGPFFGQDRKASEFRDWLDTVGTSEQLPEGSFQSDKSGLPTTGVNARVVVIDKPQAGETTTTAKASASPADDAGGAGRKEVKGGEAKNTAHELMGEAPKQEKPAPADILPAIKEKLRLEKDSRRAWARSTVNDAETKAKSRAEEERLKLAADNMAPQVVAATEAAIGEYPGDIPTEKAKMPSAGTPEGLEVFRAHEQANEDMEGLWAEERELDREVASKKHGTKVREAAENRREKLRTTIGEAKAEWTKKRDAMIRMRQEHAWNGPDLWRKLGVMTSWYPGRYSEVAAYLTKAADFLVGKIAPELSTEDRGIVARDAVSNFLESPLSDSLTSRIDQKLYVFTKKANQKAAIDRVNAASPLQTHERSKFISAIENTDDKDAMGKIAAEAEAMAAERNAQEAEAERIQAEAEAKQKEANTAALTDPAKMRATTARQALGKRAQPTGSPVNGSNKLAVWMANAAAKARSQIEALGEEPIEVRGRPVTPESMASMADSLADKATVPATLLGAVGKDGEPFVLFAYGKDEVGAVNGKMWAFANTLGTGEWFTEESGGVLVLKVGGKPVVMVAGIKSEHVPPVDRVAALAKASAGWREASGPTPKTYLTPKSEAPSTPINEAAYPTLEDLGIKTEYSSLVAKAEQATRDYHAALDAVSDARNRANTSLTDEAILAKARAMSGEENPSQGFTGLAIDKLINDNPGLKAATAAVEAAQKAKILAERAVESERHRAASAFKGEAEDKYRSLIADRKWWQHDAEANAIERLWSSDPRVSVLRELANTAANSYEIDTRGEILPHDFKPGVGVGNVSEQRVDTTRDNPAAFGINSAAIEERANKRGKADWTIELTTWPGDSSDPNGAWLAGDRLKPVEAMVKLAKLAPEFGADPVLTAKGDKLVWAAGTESFAFVNPWYKSAEEPGPIAQGQSVRIDVEALKNLRGKVWARPVADTVAVAESAPAKKALTLLEKLERAADQAKERIKKRGIQSRGRTSGATTLIDDTLDLAYIVGLKAASAGVRGGQALTRIVSETITRLRADGVTNAALLNETAIRKAARAILRDGGGTAEGVLTAYAANREAIERARTRRVGKAVGNAAGVKKAVADAVREGRPEVSKPAESRAKTYLEEVQRGPFREESARKAGEDAGFVEGLGVGKQLGEDKARTSAAREIMRARREGHRAGVNQTSAAIPGLIRQAREAFKRGRAMGTLAGRAATQAVADKAAEVEGFRTQIKKLADNLPPALRGRYLNAATSARTMSNVVSTLNRMRRDVSKYNGHRAMRGVKRLAVGLPKLTQDRRYEARKALTAATAAFKIIKRPGASANDLMLASADIQAAYAEMAKHATEQRNEDRVRLIKRGVSASKMRKTMTDALGKKRPLPAGDTPGARDPGRVVLWLRKYANVRTMSYMLDGDYSGNGPFHRLYKAMARGRRLSLGMQHGFQDAMEGLVRKRGYKDLGEFLARVSGTLGSASQETIDVSIGDVARNPNGAKRLTLGQAMYVYALDAATRAKAHAGQMFTFGEDPDGPKFRLTDDDFNRVEAALTADQKALVDEIKKEYDRTFFDRLSEVNKRLNGVYLDKVAGYWGIKRAMKQSDNPDVGKGWEQLVVRALHNAAMLQERTGGSAPIVIGDFGVDVLRRSESAATIVHKADLVRAIGKTALSPAIREEINARWGKTAMERLERVVIEYAGNQLPAIDQGIRGLMSNVARAKTQLNPTTWLRNISSVFMLHAVMPYSTIAKGMGGLMNQAAYRELMQYSPELRERWSGAGGQIAYMVPGATSHGSTGAIDASKATIRQVASAAKALAGMKGLEFRRRMQDVSKPWKEMLDALTLGNVFDAAAATVAYKGYLAEAPATLSPEDQKRWAARRATEAFLQTANTNDLLNSTGLQEEARSSTITAGLLAFTSDIAKKQNVLWIAQKRGWQARSRAVAGIAMSMAWSALIAWAFAALLGGDEDDRDKAVKGRVLDEAVSMLPGGTIIRRATSPYGSAGILDSPLTGVITQLALAMDKVYDGISGGDADRTRDGLFRMFQSGSDLTGAPFGLWAGMIRRAFRGWSK